MMKRRWFKMMMKRECSYNQRFATANIVTANVGWACQRWLLQSTSTSPIVATLSLMTFPVLQFQQFLQQS